MNGVFLMLHLCTILDMGRADLSERYNIDEPSVFYFKKKKYF